MKISELGYVLVGAPTMDRWRDYGTKVLGVMAIDRADGGLDLKIDARAGRLLVRQDDADRFLAAGWLVAGPQAYEAAIAELQSADVRVTTGSAADCAARHVTAFSSFLDPAGLRHEIAWGPISDHVAFSSPTQVSGFVTGELGMGHVVLATTEHFDATAKFMTDVLGFCLSDILHIPLPNVPRGPRVYFYHCGNGRQHSYALAELPAADGCNHMMLEVRSIDDVGLCHDRAVAEKVQLTTTLGRHVNDGMFSFYMKTPTGFDIEIGAEGRVIDWSRHSVFETTRGSHWGHHHLDVEPH
jgi:3,4-dihydroxy-9,10-secoandrosta-1,3,5(10)-triene-9,17-dione 4,5-dioxygenase